MAHSFTSSLFHCVFSTKHRRSTITGDLQDRLWAFLGGVARENAIRPLAIGGVEDHVHLLLSLPATLNLAKAMQLLKGSWSKWVHDTFADRSEFAWQAGYAAFSVGVSQVEATKRYIVNQREHHRRTTFEAELSAILAKHGFDPTTQQ